MCIRLLVPLATLAWVLAACSNSSTQPAATKTEAGPTRVRPIRLGTAPPGGAFNVLGQAIAAVLNAHKPDPEWQTFALPTKGSLDTIEKLRLGQLELGLANAATTHFASLEGYPVRALMTLGPNIGFFVTRKSSGITSLSDLTGKRVALGPEGAGFSFFLAPILLAHNVNYNDLKPVYSSQAEAVTLLAENKIDAAFLGGAVPTEAIQKACQQTDAYFIPYDEIAVNALKHEFPFYASVRIPAGTYPGQKADFHGLNVGSVHLLASTRMTDDQAYQIVKTIFEYRREIARKHAAGKSIDPKIIVQDTGTAFHPGAIRFFKEMHFWPAGTK